MEHALFPLQRMLLSLSPPVPPFLGVREKPERTMPKVTSSRRRSGKRRSPGSGRNIPATPLNPKYHLIAWLEAATSGPNLNLSYTYAQLLKLVETQLTTRDIQNTLPTGNAAVFNNIQVMEVEGWSSPFANPSPSTAEPAVAITNISRLDITVGPGSAMMPKSTIADVCVGIGERAYVRSRGNASTWGAKDSSAVAVSVDFSKSNSGTATLPLTLKFHVNVW